jgi:hypothetical protein
LAILVLEEYSGLEFTTNEDVGTDSGTDSVIDIAPMGNTSQDDMLSIWSVHNRLYTPGGKPVDAQDWDSAGAGGPFTDNLESFINTLPIQPNRVYLAVKHNYKIISAIESPELEIECENLLANPTLGMMVTFKARANSAQPETPDPDYSRIYAREDSAGATKLFQLTDDGWDLPLFPIGSVQGRYAWTYSDFTSGISETDSGTDGGYRPTSTGTGALVNGTGRTGRVGIWDVESGTQSSTNNTNGKSVINWYSNHFQMGAGRLRVGAIHCGGDILGNTRDGTDSFFVIHALTNSPGGWNNLTGNAIDFMGFRNSSGSSEGFWQIMLCDGATQESYTLDGTDTPDTGWTLGDDNDGSLSIPCVEDNYFFTEIEINTDGTEAKFFVNGLHVMTVASSAASWPDSSLNQACGIQKTAGTGNRTYAVDMMYSIRQFDTNRWS